MNTKIFGKFGKKIAVGGGIALLSVAMFATFANATISSLTLTAPNGGEQWSGFQNITWDATTIEGGDNLMSIALSVDGGENYNTLIENNIDATDEIYSWDTNNTSVGLLDDGDNYRIRITDGGSGLSFSSDNFTVDNTAPETTYSILPENPDGINGWYVTNPTVTLTCTDTTTGCEKINWGFDGSNTPSENLGNTAVFNILSDGIKNIVWRATDNAGNIEDLKGPKVVKIDTEAPTIEITDDESGVANIAGGGVVFTFTFSEDVTGFDDTDVDIAGGTKGVFTVVSATEYTLVINPNSNSTADIMVDVASGVAIDIAGNENLAASQATQAVDTEAPVIDPAGTITLTNDVNSDGIASIGDEITYTEGTDSTGDTTTWTVDLSDYGLSNIATDGTHTIVADDDDGAFSAEETATDDVYNSTTGSVTLSGFTNIDNIAPVVTDANISVTGGNVIEGIKVYTTSDTATAIWDNSSTGDNNLDIDSVIATLTGSGLTTLDEPLKTILETASLPMTDTTACGGTAGDGVYEVCYDLSFVPVDIELTDVFVVVTAYDDAMNSGTDTDTSVSRLDTLAPSTPSVTLLDPINSLNETAVTITGSGEAKASIVYSIEDTNSNTVTGTSAVDNSGNINITGINVSTLNDGAVTATVTLTDQAGNSDAGSVGTDDATKDTELPTILSITTKDVDEDGEVDTAVIVFSEDILDSTVSAGNFTLGGISATTITSGTDDDNTIEISHEGVAGTDAKDVTYTPGIVTDIAGNPLEVITTADIVEIDEASPKLLSAKTTTTTTIDVTFSEDLNDATLNDVALDEFIVDSGTYSVVGASELGGVVTLTVTTMPTGATPTITYTEVDSLNDLAITPNTAITPTTVTATDGVNPDVTSVSITSNNNTYIPLSSLFPKTGDTVTLTFVSDEKIQAPTVMIDGQTATVSNASSDEINWVATYIFTGTENEGVVPFTINYQDLAGNSGSEKTTTTTGPVFIAYDKTVPTVDAGTDKEVNTSTTQEATVYDGLSGPYYWEWTQISGPGTISFSNPSFSSLVLPASATSTADTLISATAEGTYIIELEGTDTAGNTSSDTMTFIWDTTAPAVETSVPYDGVTGVATTTSTAKIVFYSGSGNIVLVDANKVTLKDNTTGDVYSTGVSVEGGNGNSTTLNINYSELAANTVYRINIAPGALRDVAGNMMIANFVSRFTTTDLPVPSDTTPPAVPVITTSTPAAAVDANYYTITGTAADNVGEQRIVNLYNGSDLAGTAVLATGNTNWTIIVALTQNASNVFTATATDGVGNESNASTSVTITEADTLDTDKPIIAVLGQNPLTLTVGDTFIDPGVTAIDATDGNISADIVFGGTITNNDITTTAGTYTVTYNVSDTTGNAADIETRTVIVNAAFDDTAELKVTGKDVIANENGSVGYAMANDDFNDGWRWVYSVTVPTDETEFQMKFSDFLNINGIDTIAAADNIRFYSTQSSDSNSTSTATVLTTAETYSDSINLNMDLQPTVPGRQIEVIVEMKVPAGSAGGSYSAQYGVQSEVPTV